MPTAKRKHAKAPAEVVIPEKIYFRIGEVSELAKLPTYVLRFWETEFSQLKPTKSSTGQRMYRRKDVEYVMQIRRLLYEDGFTIAGARERLREAMRSNRVEKQASEGIPDQGPNEVSPHARSLPRLSPSPHRTGREAGAPGGNQASNQASNQVSNQSQATLPFLTPEPGRDKRKDAELRRLRQQLCEVLDLLS